MTGNNNCVEQKYRNEYIENNRNKALKYLEEIPMEVTSDEELLFLNLLIGNVNNDTELPYIIRKELEKDYIYNIVLLSENKELKAAELMQDFDNMLMQQVATGLLEIPSANFEKIYVNEDQFSRICSYTEKLNDGSIYSIGSKK